MPYVKGKTWTTDGAVPGNAAERCRRRRDEGCLTVEMEAAAFFAVAQFRDVVFGQLLYSGDEPRWVKNGIRRQWDWHKVPPVRISSGWQLEAALKL